LMLLTEQQFTYVAEKLPRTDTIFTQHK